MEDTLFCKVANMRIKLKQLRVKLPVRLMWVFSVAIISIFVWAFIWYFGHTVFLPLQTAGSQMIQDFGTNSTTSDSIETFFTYADTYILVLALIGLALYVWTVSQKRGVPVYEY